MQEKDRDELEVLGLLWCFVLRDWLLFRGAFDACYILNHLVQPPVLSSTRVVPC